MDLYSQLRAKSSIQPIQYPLQSRLNKSEFDIIHIDSSSSSSGGGGGGGAGGSRNIVGNPLSIRGKKSSQSESHLTVIMGPTLTHPAALLSTTTQDEIWAMLQKERRYIERNIYCEENEVVVTEESSKGYLSKGGKLTSSCEDNHFLEGNRQELQPVGEGVRQMRKLSAPVLPLNIRRQQSRGGDGGGGGSQLPNLPPLVSGASTSALEESQEDVSTSVGGGRGGSKPKRLRSPTMATKPSALRLKTDYDDDQEIIFSSSCKFDVTSFTLRRVFRLISQFRNSSWANILLFTGDLPTFSSSTSHIDHCSNRGEHHTSSVRLTSGRGHGRGSSSHMSYNSSEDIPKAHPSSLRGRISPASAAGMSKQTLSKYRSYSVPKRLDNSTLNFSEINLDVALLPIFHKILSERRSLRDSHHHRHHSHHHPPRTVDRSKKADKEKFMVSCPNIMIKCDIVEYL